MLTTDGDHVTMVTSSSGVFRMLQGGNYNTISSVYWTDINPIYHSIPPYDTLPPHTSTNGSYT